VNLTLGIATATSQVGVALAGPDGPVASLHVRQGRRHAELLAPGLETLLRMAGAGMSSVGRIVVDVGPGLFTGLRVGVASAKALASARDLPIVGCSSLEILAHPHLRSGRTVASVVDARRGEVFWAVYEPSETGMVAVTHSRVDAPATVANALVSLASRSGDKSLFAVGDGAERYSDVLGAVPGVEIAGPMFAHPNADVLIDLASDRPSVPLAEITPRYLRGADVRIGWQERATALARSGAAAGPAVPPPGDADHG
jgi:tRNA threonylcarbamoyladenosine biosynthesis protein TsaB